MSPDVKLFVTIYGLVLLAELPDKTSMASLVMAARWPPLAVFLGACGAFVVHAALAVGLGSVLGLLPERWVHLGVGLLFVLFAVLMWRPAAQGDDMPPDRHETFIKALGSAFFVVFLAEWGDLTQFTMAGCAARYHQPLLVFSASVLALWSVTGVGVTVGAQLHNIASPRLMSRLAAIVFAAVGIYLTWEALAWH